MGQILNLELQTVAQSGGTAFDQACFIVAMQVVAELHARATALENQAHNLVIAQNPGLVDANGNPLSRPARRRIEKMADEMVPEASETETPQA
jgi:hypothetical protein